MTRRRRSNFSADEKVHIVREHLVESVAVSTLCEEYGLQPSQYYKWQKQPFENGSAALARRKEPETARLEREVKRLEKSLAEREEAISERASEYIALRKAAWGCLDGT